MRIDSLANGAQINMQTINGLNLSELASRLSPGDIVRAQILDFVANEVLLKLFDSTTLRATVPDDFEGEVGKFRNFLVKESLPDKLILEEQKSFQPRNQSENTDIMKALSKIGISNTDDNIKLARSILENNIPLTKDFFNNASKLLQSSREIDIPKAIFMEANKIDANIISIKQLGLLEKGSVSLGNELNELIALLDGENPENLSKAGTAAQTSTTALDMQNSDITKNGQNITDNKGMLLDNSGINSTLKTDDTKLFDAKSFLKMVEESMKPKEDLSIKADSAAQIKDTTAKRDATEKNVKQAAANQSMVNDHESSSKITKELKNELEKLFIKLDDFTKDKDIELEKNIKTMAEKLENIKEELNNLNINNKDVIIQKADNILNQLRFINDIKNFGYYVPIPLKLNGVMEQADLYVLKRNKNKKVNPEDATVFLALDTSNMGRVETLLCINKKSINMNIRIETKEYEDYIRTRFVDLYNLLGNKGYKLTDIKYRQISEPVSVFNVNKVANELLSTNSSGVDIRL